MEKFAKLAEKPVQQLVLLATRITSMNSLVRPDESVGSISDPQLEVLL